MPEITEESEMMIWYEIKCETPIIGDDIDIVKALPEALQIAEV